MKRLLVGGLVLAGFLCVSGCTSSTGHRSSPDPAGSTAPSTAGPTAGSTAPSTAGSTAGSTSGSTAPSTVTSTGATSAAVHAADPARYHVGRVDPTGPASTDPAQVSFRTPSRNIACTVLSGQSVTCQTTDRTYAAAPRPADCTLNWLGADPTLSSAGVRLGVCAGNPVVLQDSTVLPYGYRLTSGVITCTSESAALTCADSATGHRFVLNSARVVLD